MRSATIKNLIYCLSMLEMHKSLYSIDKMYVKLVTTFIMLQSANELLRSDTVSKAVAMLGVGWLVTSYTFTMLLTGSTDLHSIRLVTNYRTQSAYVLGLGWSRHNIDGCGVSETSNDSVNQYHEYYHTMIHLRWYDVEHKCTNDVQCSDKDSHLHT